MTRQLDKRMQFRGLSGELMRKAMCHLIMCCSTAKMNFHDDPIIGMFFYGLADGFHWLIDVTATIGPHTIDYNMSIDEWAER